MARVFGEPGRNAAEESHRRTKRLLIAAFVGLAALGFLGGLAIGGVVRARQLRLSWSLMMVVAVWIGAWLIAKWSIRRVDAMDRERMEWRKGAVGEALVSATLKQLPNDFVVVNDVSKRLGNIDHVVIGPTGVYLIDTKNWTGSVKADGTGELLLNGQPPQKPAVKTLLRAVMDFQAKLKALTETDRFVRGLLVFPNAYVEANYGSTRQVHCLRTEQLNDYLQNQTFAQRLTTNDLGKIKRATLQLANMDENFAASQN